jgi:hypothetical protein
MATGSEPKIEAAIAKLAADIQAAALKHALVGVPEDDQVGRETASNALLAYIHDNGSVIAGIPQREFMRPGIKNAESNIAAALKNGIQLAVIARDPELMQAGLHRAGLTAQSAIRAKITSNISPALASSTLKRRRQRGVTRTSTLIDTGALRQSITYVIEDGEE